MIFKFLILCFFIYIFWKAIQFFSLSKKIKGYRDDLSRRTSNSSSSTFTKRKKEKDISKHVIVLEEKQIRPNKK